MNVFGRIALVVLVAGLTFVSHAATRTWDGGGADAFWSNHANWAGDTAPEKGDDLVFPAGAAQLANWNDFATTYGSITIAGSGYRLEGLQVRLTGGLRATYESGISAVHCPLIVAAGQSFSASAGGTMRLANIIILLNKSALTFTGPGDFLVDASIIGDGGIVKDGGGTVTLTSDNSFEGGVEIRRGVISAEDPAGGTAATGTGTVKLTSPTRGAKLRGSGSAGAVVNAGGRVEGGTLTDPSLDVRSITFGATQEYFTALSEGVARRLRVTGTVNLKDAVLRLEDGGDPAPGTQFTIIENDGDEPVAGAFARHADGSTFRGSANSYRITYAGGDGNDVVLIATGADLRITSRASTEQAAIGDTVAFDFTVSNAGPHAATNVILTDRMPAGMTFVSAAADHGACVHDSGSVVCSLATIERGKNVRLSIVAKVATNAPVTNEAVVEATERDPRLADNADRATVNAAAPAAGVPALDARALVAVVVAVGIAALLVLRR